MPDDDGLFGADPAPDNVIPFPSMRPNAKLSEAWAREVEASNRKAQTKHQFVSPADVVDALVKMRGMPKMPWPAEWPELARRCRTYVGECNAFVGSIGGGKTQRGIQLARAVSGAGLPVIWAPLELGKEQLIARILGNMNGEHAMHVLDEWDEGRIRHQISAVTDMWHFVDRYDDPEVQIAAIRDCIEVTWRIYRLPPLFVVDHIGQLICESDNIRGEMLRYGKRFEKIALETKCWGLLLAQGTKSGQQLLTGKVEIESAADAIGAAAESSIMQQVCSNVIVSQLYKEDDAMVLQGRDLIAKARWTGAEGQVGTEYSKPGGVWSETGHLPPTPGEVKAAEEAEKKDKNRTAPARGKVEIRAELSAGRAGTEDAKRRAELLKLITRAGATGLAQYAMRDLRGISRGAGLLQNLAELEQAGLVERAAGRWRAVTR
jgi:hypothetical protein